MSTKTKIEWTDRTWSPLRVRVRSNAAEIARVKGYTSLVEIGEEMAGRSGQYCQKISPGCVRCYAETMQRRGLPYNGTRLPYDARSLDLLEPYLDEKELLAPLRWRKPCTVFPCSQTDMFGDWWPDEFRDRMFAVMAITQHRYMVLTKRADRMERYFGTVHAHGLRRFDDVRKWIRLTSSVLAPEIDWPLPNLWLGVSVENQEQADKRIPHLLRTPAAVRFLSCEPLLEDLGKLDLTGIHWVIVGGESGPGARRCNLDWIRSIVRQCKAAGVPPFVKQVGANPVRHMGTAGELSDRLYRLLLKDRKGGDMDEWPEDLPEDLQGLRQFPEVAR